jgi:ABC-type transport system involved in multi-copper enzyme maturation permease subunit
MSWRSNPVLLKELRSRMRGPRAFVFLTISLLILAGICGLLYAVEVYSLSSMGIDTGAIVGRTLFGALAISETVMIALFTPSISAGAISGEEERKTLELLLVTPLKHHTILWGKLLSSLAYIGLLVLAAIPLASLVLLFGGVSPWEMLLALGLLLVFMLAFDCLGLFCSVVIRRTGWARGVALGMVFFLLGGSAFLAGTVGILLTQGTGGDPTWFLAFNPIVAMMEVVVPEIDFGLGLPLWAYTAGGYVLWAAALYVGGLFVLRRRRADFPEKKERNIAVLTIVGVVLLTLFGLCAIPALLTHIVPP